MNIVQEIIALLFRAKYPGFFRGSFTTREIEFFQYLTVSYFYETMEVKKDYHNPERIFLVWKFSESMSVSCLVSSKGFHFSTLGVWNPQTGTVTNPVSKIPNGITRKGVISQVEEIKSLFLLYSVDAEVYFK